MSGPDNPLPGVPVVESPFFEALAAAHHFDDHTLRVARDLNRDGFAVIDFPDPDFDAVAERIKANLHNRFDWPDWRDRGFAAGECLRVQDAWQSDADVRRLATNLALIELLSKLFGREAWPFQTLNFPVGTQQHYHSDSLHFSSMPERFMCGVWTALEDVEDESGPLVYYPGTHKWPIYSNVHIGIRGDWPRWMPGQACFEPVWQRLIEQHGLAPRRFLARKGQALIWLANLLHGGVEVTDPGKTRWSQVTHYFFSDCSYYTPVWSDPFAGTIVFREVRNIVTGEIVPNRYAGRDLSPDFMRMVAPDYVPRGAALRRRVRRVLGR